jgi:tetratricopeptide (TPR) repeat protein
MTAGVTSSRFHEVNVDRRSEAQRPLMPYTSLCIVARSMRRLTERARIATLLSAVLASGVLLGGLGGCEQLDARNRIRKGNRLFRETQFIDATAEYHRALKEVDDPIVHYNLALSYSKIFKPGYQAPVLLGTKDEFVCQEIPGVRLVDAGACVKPGDRHFAECGASKTRPLDAQIAELESQIKAATDEEKKKELEIERKDKQDELLRFTCPSSFSCVESQFGALTSPEIADLSAQHFQIWIKAQPSDEEIKAQLVEANRELEEAKKVNNQSAISSATRRVEDLQTKDIARKMMTRLWMDSEQHKKALEYWNTLLKEKPNDTEYMRMLAGIHLSAGDWRASTDLFNKIADLVTDPSGKVAEFQYIGNIAWARLNTKQLIGVDAVELADRGIGALQRAAELQPKNSRLVSLQASLINFRSTAHGSSLASAIDRATAQDLSKLQRVLSEEAKNAQGQTSPGGTPGTPGSAAPAPTNPGTPGAPGTPATSGTPETPSAPPAPAPGGTPAAPAPPGTPETPAPPAPATGGTVEKSGG